jgi:CHAT domain-containing protein
LQGFCLTIAAFVAAMVGATGDASAQTLDDCRKQIAAEGPTRAAAACAYRAAGTSRNAADALLEDTRRSFPDSGWLAFYRGRLALQDGPAVAIPWFRAALQSFRARSDDFGETETRMALIPALFDDGDIPAAWDEAGLAVAAARRHGDRLLLALALAVEAWLSLESGERLARASRALREADALLATGGPTNQRQDILSYLGSISLTLGEYDDAIGYWTAAAALARDAGDTQRLSQHRFNVLTARRKQMEQLPDLSRRAELVEEAREVLELAVASKEPSRLAEAHRALGDLLATAATPDEAEAHYRAALALSREAKNLGDLSTSLWVLGRHLASKRPEEARRLLDEALDLAVESNRPSLVAYAWRQQMRFAWMTLARDRAVVESRRALDVIETIRQLQDAERAAAGVFAPWTLDYRWLVGRALSAPVPTRSDLTFAFEVSERMRARLLFDALLRARSGSLADEAARGKLLRDLSSAQTLLLNPRLDATEQTALIADVERLENEWEVLRSAARAGSASSGAVVSLDQIERGLGPDEALLSFTIGVGENFYGESGGGASVLVVSRAGTRAVQVPELVALRAMTSVLRGLTEHGAGGQSRPAIRLYEALLKEAIQGLPESITRLIVVPDGPLHHLPFAALRIASDSPALGETHEIAVVPSAAVWLHLREQRRPPKSRSALILADPRVPAAIRDEEAAAEREWLGTALRLGPLPYARREGRAIASRVGGASRLLTGELASEARLKDADHGSFGVVHFAAHSVVDEKHPDRSAILLAGSPHGEDGLLQAREIAGLDFTGLVVVLSACRSASGVVLAGEGVLGLSRAFLEAGATTVVGTLWTIQDDHAAHFFEAFYASLSRGRTVGAALADARRAAIADGLPTSAWAGVIAIGDDTVTIGGSASPSPWLMAGGAILLVLVIVAVLGRLVPR